MAIPKINYTDFFQTFVDKVNSAIDRITGTFTRNGKTLTITADDGTPITLDLSASPNTVISGVVITQDGANQRLFNASAGTVRIEENEIAVAGGSTLTGNGDPTNPRIDALVIDSTGLFKIASGTAAALPTPPTVASNELIIGYLYVEANATDINENIYYLSVFDSSGNGIYQKGGEFINLLNGENIAIELFTSISAGTVPASGGGTANFLRADGTWNPPSTSSFLSNTVTTAAINTDQDDFTAAGFGPNTYLRFNATANIDLRGFLATPFAARDIFGFSNIGTGNIRVINNSVFSAANNRILTNGFFIIKPNHGCIFVRDGVSSRFRVFVHRT